MNRALRVAVVAIATAAVAALLFPIYLRVLAGDTKVFEPQSFDSALVAIGTFGIAVGIQIVPWRAATNVAVLGTLVGGGLLFGALAILSIGVLVLPVAIVLLFVLARAIGRARLSAARPAALGGPSLDTAWSSCLSRSSFLQRSSASRTAVGAPRASAGAKAAAVTP